MASQDQLKAQLKEIMSLPENMVCVDCDDKRPTWASLIVPPPDAAFTEPIGCFCCYHCSGAHRRMGTHICFVRSTNLDEWKPKEVEAMKKGGNDLINRIFEGKLTKTQKAAIKPDKHTDLDPRSNYIYDKYQHRKWYDEKLAKTKSAFVQSGKVPTPEKRTSAGSEAFDLFFAGRTKVKTANEWPGGTGIDEDAAFDAFNTGEQSFASVPAQFPSSDQGQSRKILSPGIQSFSDGFGQSKLEKPKSKRQNSNLSSSRDRSNENDSREKSKKNPPDRSKSSSSKDSETGRHRSSRDINNENDPKEKSKRNPPDRSKSSSSKDSETGRRRGVRRSSSHDSAGMESGNLRTVPSRRTVSRTSSNSSRNEQSIQTEQPSTGRSSSRRRGVGRTKSMGATSEHSDARRRRRSKSVKRIVRRSHSDDDGPQTEENGRGGTRIRSGSKNGDTLSLSRSRNGESSSLRDRSSTASTASRSSRSRKSPPRNTPPLPGSNNGSSAINLTRLPTGRNRNRPAAEVDLR